MRRRPRGWHGYRDAAQGGVGSTARFNHHPMEFNFSPRAHNGANFNSLVSRDPHILCRTTSSTPT